MDVRQLFSELFPFLVILYAADCLWVLRGGQLLFTSRVTGGFRIRRSVLAITGLTPFSWGVLSDGVPVPLTARGIYLPRHRVTGGFRPWSIDDFDFLAHGEIVDIEVDGRRVKVNGRWCLTSPSAMAAQRLAGSIRRMKQAACDGEVAVSAHHREAFNLERLRQERDRLCRLLAPLEIWSSSMYIGLFGLLPLALLFRVLSPLTIPAIGLTLISYAAAVFSFYIAHKRLFPAAAGERIEAMATLFLLPVGAAHGVSKLTRNAFSDFDPLALTLLFTPERWPDIAKKEFLRAEHTAEGQSADDFSAYWRNRAGAIRSLAEIQGVNTEFWRTVPAGLERDASAYCVLCETPYLSGGTACPDCGTVLARV